MKRCRTFGCFFALEFPAVSSLVQQQIIMQHARVYRAWLPPETPPKYGNVVEREEKIVNSCNREKNLYFYITPSLATIHFPFRFAVRIADFVFFVSLSSACLACERSSNSETAHKKSSLRSNFSHCSF